MIKSQDRITILLLHKESARVTFLSTACRAANCDLLQHYECFTN